MFLGEKEINLDEDDFSALYEVFPIEDGNYTFPSIDLFVKIFAQNREEIEKGKLVLVTLLAALGLASCGGKTAKDETSPVISGAANMSCAVNETIDLLKGVTAVDDVDGDVTEAIEITLMPSLTVTNGKVTPILDGDYEVKYAVTDKAGNEGTAFATLNVTPALAEKEV